jgi:KDO2-lipid IV(A) lauroyltransferase
MAERGRWSPLALAEFALARGLLGTLAVLPTSVAYAAGAAIGRAAFRLDRRHRQVVLENLRQALPGQHTEAERRSLAQSVFEHLGRTAVDTARARRHLDPADPAQAAFDGIERLREGKARGKGVLTLSAHLGPWELIPAIGAHQFEPVSLVARPLDNPWLDGYVNARRAWGGNRVLSKKDSGRAILQALRRGETVGMLIDQHIREADGVIVPFFGRPASTAVAPAVIALRSEAAVFAMGIHRVAPGRYRLCVGEEVRPSRTGDLRLDLVRTTAAFNAALERLIREHPEQWFWVHRRWKTPQPLDPLLSGAEARGD